MQSLRVIISGGGTGGHIFPAIAIANALKRMSKETEILFVGAKGKMEMEKVPAAGYKIEGLTVAGFQRGFSPKNIAANLTFPFKVIGSLTKSRSIIKQFKPDVVVGVGGFASGPVMYAAQMRKIPTLIQEQNSYAGVTNKILGKKASKICVAYDGMEKFFPKEKIILTGNPVRQDILTLANKRERGLEHFSLNPEKKTLLVIGGSLGARSINLAMKANLQSFIDNDIQVVWQTGKLFHEEAKEAAKGMEDKGIRVYDFISKMDYAYAVADVVVSRAGASSISEICIVRKPAVLVPFPFAAEDHQTSNAMALVTHHAAILVKDNETQERLCNEALELLQNDEKREKLIENVGKLAFSNADEAIANEIIRLGNSRK